MTRDSGPDESVEAPASATTDRASVARRVKAPDIPEPLFPTYSQVLCVPLGEVELVFISGQVAPPAEEPGPDELRRQVTCCYEQMRTILEAAGGTLGDIVSTTAYVTDIARLAEIAAVRGELVGDPPPTSTIVEVAALARPDLVFEISGTAAIHRSEGDPGMRRRGHEGTA